MYIVGKYYQGNPDQKPEQWGSIADVQYAVRQNCEDWLGVDYFKLEVALPLWDVKNQRDYSKNNLIGVNNNAVKTIDCLDFNGSGAFIEIPNVKIQKKITALCQIQARSWANFESFLGCYNTNMQLTDSWGFLFRDNFLRFTINSWDSNFSGIAFPYNIQLNESILTGVYDQNEINIYNNYTKGLPDSYTADIITTNNPKITLGKLSQSTSSYSFDGKIFFCYIFSTALNQKQIFQLNDQPYKLFQPVSRPLYFDFTDLPVSPEYASVISEKINTISEFQKEGFATSTLSEKTNLISGFEKQAEISSVVTETATVTSAGTSTEFEEYSYTSDINEIIALNTEKEKTSYYASIINETASLSTEFEKNINHTSYINETIEITSYGSATESASYSSIINETASLSTEFEKNINHTSYINETIDLNSQAEKNINHVSDINEIIALNTEKEKTSYYASIINEAVFLTSTTSSFEEYSYISKISEEIHSFSEGTKTFSENKEFFASVFLSSESFKMSEYSSFIQEYLVLSLKEEENLFIFVDGNTKSLYDGNTFNIYNGFIKEEK